MTVDCKWHRFFFHWESQSEVTDSKTSRLFLSSKVPSSTDLECRNSLNIAHRSMATSSGLTAACDQLSSTSFELKTLSSLSALK